ncbi:hypothetical protein KEM55_004331, partial [Ascosphaera atra]
GRFRSSYSGPERIMGATKYCVFDCNTPVNEEISRDAVSQRLSNMRAEKIDLLQFHWQDYTKPEYIRVLRLLAADERITLLGLCNFDTKRMLEVIEAGVPVVTNQVQFSLIDSRPKYAMADACIKYGVKLTTYGTLCGGFLADRWLDREEPEKFEDYMTPSLRKYLVMIKAWGGWSLFQRLLHVLKSIADKHEVCISAVATRWVLDHEYVGAVIIGTRMGVSEHTTENKKVYGWRLDEDDQRAIEEVLSRSQRDNLIQDLGDCGGEYGERG